jgi:hypothetical protein
VAIEDRLRRLEDANPTLCEPRPCKGPVTWGQTRLRPDGSVEVSGERPQPLCDVCPARDDPKGPPITHVEVLHGFPPGRDVWEVVEATESAAREHENTAILRVVYDD